jgi:tetratricopeptide (TPR) repeat protein
MLCLIALFVLGCTTPETGLTKSVPSSSVPTAWAVEVATIDAEIEATRARLKKNANQWLVESQLAGLYSNRARLSGDYDDYASAERALDRAFDIAPAGSGPFLARASLNFTLHRLNAVETDLLAAEAQINIRKTRAASIALMRARVDMERGNYDDAAAGYAEVQAMGDTLQIHTALSHHAGQTGDMERSETELAIAESMYHGRSAEPRAWFHLQRAIADLDADRYDDALAHLSDADAALPGYWLVQEHIAEILALQGDYEGALAIYEVVVPRTGSPELMGAMAGVLSELGRDAEAKHWVKLADRLFATRLQAYPEASYGHALEHFLEYGEPEDALELAQANAALRPNGPALELLAKAYLKADRVDDARATELRAADIGWVGR